MAVSYLHSIQVLDEIAASLATEATTAGNTALSTALTAMKNNEISADGMSETIFYNNGVGQTWSMVLRAAADVIITTNQSSSSASQTTSSNKLNVIAEKLTIIADKQTTIADKQTTIAAKQTTIATDTGTIADKQTIIADKQTIIAAETITIDNHLNRVQSVVDDMTTTCSTGPHFRTVVGGCEQDMHNSEIGRAMMVLNLKETNKLDALVREVESPTRIGHLPMPHEPFE